MNHLGGGIRKIKSRCKNDEQQRIYMARHAMIKKKCDQLGLPYFKVTDNPNESQDVKRLNMVSKVWQKRNPIDPANIRSFAFKKRQYTPFKQSWTRKYSDSGPSRPMTESVSTVDNTDITQENISDLELSLSDFMTSDFMPSDQTFPDSIF